jgi:tetratricopeptide (TPR) repeat protein
MKFNLGFKQIFLPLLFLASVAGSLQARKIFIPKGANWRYQNGEDEFDPKWKNPDFDDSKWEKGFAPFGYGRYSRNTFVGSRQNPRPITTYYRTDINLEDPKDWDRIEIQVKVDDGAVVYVNGKPAIYYRIDEIVPMRPEVTANYSVNVIKEYQKATLSGGHMRSLFVAGKNSIAVGVHQNKPKSSDLIFDLALSGVEKGMKEEKVITEKSEWKYFDGREVAADDWAALDFDDSGWKSGRAILGYGDKDVTTKVDYGSDKENKPATVWFRKEFEIESSMDVQGLRMDLIRDDGAIIYINGEEVARDQMPQGFVDARTLASGLVWSGIERIRHEFLAPGGNLVVGKNIVAIEVHQNGVASSDLAFDLSMVVEYFEQEAREEVKVVATSKVVDITDAESLKKSEASDWLLSSEKFMEKAIGFHATGKLQPAVHSYYASKWAEVFAGKAANLDPALKNYLLGKGQVALSQEFFDLQSKYDKHQRVFEIINDLFKEQAEAFKAFPKLALAIGLVYDQEPPIGWPHHQVPDHVLPRELPDPEKAMEFWVATERGGKSLHPLADLSIEELKYVVDTPVPFEQLKEAREELRVRLRGIGDLYPGIEYVHERLENNTYNWPHASYALTEIKERGGICVDQAFYTSQVAKAHGVPSMVVSGSGNNGNHAWVGFLDSRGRWDFTVGRYEESKFVTGVTYDPQTWLQPTDHELAMMSERFRTNSKFRISRIHTVFSDEYLSRGKMEQAVKAAETAIDSEERNYSAWEALIKAKRAAKVEVKEMDLIYENGAKAFSRYADLEAGFLRRLASSYEKQDRLAEAEKLRARIISRNRRERPDLALQEAKVALDEAMESDSPEEQTDLYKKQISRLKDAGLIAYYALTNPFLEHLIAQERKDLAKTALEYTERRMDVEEGSQLESALFRWKREVE